MQERWRVLGFQLLQVRQCQSVKVLEVSYASKSHRFRASTIQRFKFEIRPLKQKRWNFETLKFRNIPTLKLLKSMKWHNLEHLADKQCSKLSEFRSFKCFNNLRIPQPWYCAKNVWQNSTQFGTLLANKSRTCPKNGRKSHRLRDWRPHNGCFSFPGHD